MLTCYHWTTYKHAVSLTFSACICICICSDNSPFYALSATCRQRKTELLELKISNDWKNCTLPLQGVIIVVDEQNTAKKKNPTSAQRHVLLWSALTEEQSRRQQPGPTMIKVNSNIPLLWIFHGEAVDYQNMSSLNTRPLLIDIC